MSNIERFEHDAPVPKPDFIMSPEEYSLRVDAYFNYRFPEINDKTAWRRLFEWLFP